MTWKNHRLTTFTIAFALTGSLPATAIATASAVLPDALELNGILGHRTVTHYPWFYLAPTAILWGIQRRYPGYLLYILFFVLVGCICHLLEDLLSMKGVPLKMPYGCPTGLKFYATHQSSETFTAWAIIFCSGLLAWHKGMLSKDFLMVEADRTAMFVIGFSRQFVWY